MTNGFIFIEWINFSERGIKMSMVGQYVVIGTFVNNYDDIVLGYFDTLDEAKEFESEFESEDLEFTNIYQLGGVK